MSTRTLIALVVAMALFLSVQAAYAEETAVTLGDSDGVVDVVKASVGQNVELRLKSGEKIAGTVMKVSEKAVHIGRISGMEFYDAVIDTKHISAVVVRARKSLK